MAAITSERWCRLLVPAEKITANKGILRLWFAWRFAGGARTVSAWQNAARHPFEEAVRRRTMKGGFHGRKCHSVIPCMQVLGAYPGDVRALIFEKGLAFFCPRFAILRSRE